MRPVSVSPALHLNYAASSSSCATVPSLEVEQLAVSRGDRTLAAGICWRLGAGEVMHLRGANGAGKSSLLEVLAGLRRPAAGMLRRDPDPMPLHWVGHRNALNPHLSAVENLRFWCEFNGQSIGRIAPALDRLALPAGARRRAVRTLSAGQKRRTALARLVLAPRSLWLLDEPLDGLDVDGIATFSGLLSEHLKSGGIAVVTSHQALPNDVSGVREWVLRR
jgi:heme exporter protein A